MTDLKTATSEYLLRPEVQDRLTNAHRFNSRELMELAIQFAFSDGAQYGHTRATSHASEAFEQAMSQALAEEELESIRKSEAA